MTDIYDWAVAKFGPPNLSTSTKDEIRFGPSSKISVRAADGVWNEFGTKNAGLLIPAGLRVSGYWERQRASSRQSEGLQAFRNKGASAPQQNRLQRAKDLWERGQRAGGSPAEAYLEARGVTPPNTAIKYVPNLWHGPSRSKWPAMIAEITDMASGEFIGVHRTFLDGSAKAPITPNKMILGSKKGGVIRLVEDELIDTRLALAEGIETALTAIRAGWSCWAAVDAGNLRVLPVWPATDLIIFADNDESDTGLEAARHLARRWKEAGGYVEISMPKQEGTDWNDLLK